MVLSAKDADNGVVEFQFYRPDNRTKWEAFQKAIYDRSSNQFLGRTPKNWGQLFVFYSMFYVVLAALFAVCMQGLFATLDERQPKWKLGDSLIGKNPGLGFRPISDKTEEGSLVWYNISNHTTINKYVKLIDSFLLPYENQTGRNYVKCDFRNSSGNNEVCKMGLEEFGRCSRDRMYGYNTTSPCLFLKLNRIIDWEPRYYSTPQPDMPDALKDYITKLQKNNAPERRIWVSCNGINDIDKEHVTAFNYFPSGFASYYYPYKNVKNYLSPIVAVELVDVKPNVVISIECRAWAENIEYIGGSLNRAGSVTFEIQVDTQFQPPSKDGVTQWAKPMASAIINPTTVSSSRV